MKSVYLELVATARWYGGIAIEYINGAIDAQETDPETAQFSEEQAQEYAAKAASAAIWSLYEKE